SRHFILPHSRHPWSSCGLLYRNLLIIGDYSGNVAGYLLDTPEPVIEFSYVHGNNGVTCLKQKPQSQFVYSSGRNGKIVEYMVEAGGSTDMVVGLTMLRTVALFPNMQWIGGLQFFGSSDIRFVYGFDSRNLMVWDLLHNIVVVEHE